MRSFVTPKSALKMRGASAALAIALAMGTVVGVTGFADTAHAQKKDKKAKPSYSKEYIAVYKPIEDAVNAEPTAVATVKGSIPALIAASISADEKLATGNILYNGGVKSQDQALQLQGMNLMLGSGLVPAENIGQYNIVGYQLANALKDTALSRTFLKAAIDANYGNETTSTDDLRFVLVESYFADGMYDEGLAAFKNAIAIRKASGQVIKEDWYKRGLSVAYKAEQVPGVYEIIAMWLPEYQSPGNWRDSINIARNLNDYKAPEMLDLLRLSNRVSAMQNKMEYIDFIEAADPRRLPKEVETVIEQGYASGVVSRDDIYVADSLKTAKTRMTADRADLPALEKDARAASASLRTVSAAGDAFLNYGEYAKAEEFFQKSLGMPGVDANVALTRLGIAQAELGKYDAALETFGKVTGNRAAIARLWSIYVAGKKAGATS
ncbi:TPR repeat [Altererythrobacter epoxidivorans]|uniref:TPR repeat n=1 Tax=Altererythrobacter epoxidivorans TaxID=361183 RepID=A0A0M5L6W6_9SPHN|nr:hypothetical protein [Altererythrobacter epoxidivorans]ALE16494.1 TPR repeat [Altererythrobacter epoxidivorans]